MRIAYLSIGRHVHTERWIRFFVDRGHECHLLTVQPGPIDGVTVHDIRTKAPTKPLRYLKSLGEVRSILNQIQPDLLHTHFLTGYGYWGHFSGFQPNVLTVWGDDVYVTPHETPIKKWLAKKAVASAAAITGDSVDILKDCVKLGADGASCFEINWGVDFDTFHPARASSVRAKLGIAPDDAVIFSPRSFTQPYYNIDVIVKATARVIAERPRVQVIFSGYEGESARFEQQARDAGLNGHAHFVGRIPHENFAEYLVASDVFVSVPSVDATAVSLLEAMACGRAIVISSLPSSLEWIEAGQTGEVVPPRDEDALVAALLRLVDDPRRRQDYGERCLAEVRARADHTGNMEWVEAIYQNCVEGKPLPTDLHPIQERATT